MSYWSQWFKVNYPLEFWTTALQFSKEGEVPYRLAELRTRYAVNGGVKLRIMMINNLYSNLPLIIKEVDMPVVYNTLYNPLIVTVICEIENATIPPLSILYVRTGKQFLLALHHLVKQRN